MLQRLGMAARPVFDVLRKAGPFASVAIVILQIVAGVLTTWSLLLTAHVLNAFIKSGVPNREYLNAILPSVLLLLLAYAIKLAVDVVTNMTKARLVPRVHRVAEQQLLEASLGVQLAAFDTPEFYDQLHRARDRGVMHLETATESMVEVLSTVITVIGAAAAIFLLHPLLLPILILALLPEGWAALYSARLQYAQMPQTIALMRQADMVIELATQRESAAEIRAHQAEAYVLSDYDSSAKAVLTHRVELGIAQARAKAYGYVLSGVGLIGTFVALLFLLRAGWLPLAAAGTAVIAIRTSSAALSRMMLLLNDLFEKGLYIADFRDFLEKAKKSSHSAATQSAPDRPAVVELKQVGFSYPGMVERKVLQDISLHIRAGQTIALVGENGSGKTTLAKLIAGLYQPSEGSICWDGIDMATMTRTSVADRIVMVLQEPVRWPKSARENVRVGRHARDDPDDRALLDAGLQSRSSEVIERLPQRWRTLLSRRFKGGHDLSGGQWQRLAVARGLFRDAPILIWDEPTSSLDAKAELAVYESLRKLAQGKTVILITHRLASVRNADVIFFLENGALVEHGTHKELLAIDGCYAQLYKLQAQLNAWEHKSVFETSVLSP